jgi:hypothetical protein
MVMRLIDADAMHKFVEDKVAEGKDGWANGVPYEWAYALTAVDAQPTIDAVPVVHAHWIKTFGSNGFVSTLRCSKCGNAENSTYIPGNFCWFCGARMDGEAE